MRTLAASRALAAWPGALPTAVPPEPSTIATSTKRWRCPPPLKPTNTTSAFRYAPAPFFAASLLQPDYGRWLVWALGVEGRLLIVGLGIAALALLLVVVLILVVVAVVVITFGLFSRQNPS